jgi:hypothetical protein
MCNNHTHYARSLETATIDQLRAALTYNQSTQVSAGPAGNQSLEQNVQFQDQDTAERIDALEREIAKREAAEKAVSRLSCGLMRSN